MSTSPIGVFDSGYGGLTILRAFVQKMPQYDYLYLGDNARAPYGDRSFETVYEYTLQSVKWLLERGCPLVILACNTASAKALRTIQQNDLPRIGPDRRVLGVIRPTTEIIGRYSKTGKIGILGTSGTVNSQSYPIEISKFFPDVAVFQHACPMWVPLVENDQFDAPGADYFVKNDLDTLLAADPGIDTILLACTHYPLLLGKISHYIPPSIRVIAQGGIVAESLWDYLARHPEIESSCSRTGQRAFFTTDTVGDFDRHSANFFGTAVHSRHVDLPGAV